MNILGMGRVGLGLERCALKSGIAVNPITRDHGWVTFHGQPKCPTLVCVNAGDLSAVIRRTPKPHRAGLVFIQNGMIDTALEELGCSENTRGLLYFAVPNREAVPEPGDDSIFTGPRAAEVVEWLNSIGLPARSVSRSAFGNEMGTKLIWNCVYGLLCDVHSATVGTIVLEHSTEAEIVTRELVEVMNAASGTTIDTEATIAGHQQYSLSISDYKGTVKQWPWRNGWFAAAALKTGVATPAHNRLLVGRGPDSR